MVFNGIPLALFCKGCHTNQIDCAIFLHSIQRTVILETHTMQYITQGSLGRVPCLGTALRQSRHSSLVGIVMQDGDDWKTLRRFTLRALKDFGLGKSSLEDKIKDELENVLDELDKTIEVPFCPQKLFYQSVSNIICSIIFGHRSVHEYFVVVPIMISSHLPHQQITPLNANAI